MQFEGHLTCQDFVTIFASEPSRISMPFPAFQRSVLLLAQHVGDALLLRLASCG
jgi:hypothetical protein